LIPPTLSEDSFVAKVVLKVRIGVLRNNAERFFEVQLIINKRLTHVSPKFVLPWITDGKNFAGILDVAIKAQASLRESAANRAV
jgi:hypothetical protein